MIMPANIDIGHGTIPQREDPFQGKKRHMNIAAEKKLGYLLAILLTVGVGVLIYLPGFTILFITIRMAVNRHAFPNPLVILSAILLIFLGSMLIWHAYKAIRSGSYRGAKDHIKYQWVFTLFIAAASLFFIGIATLLVVESFYYKNIPLERGIGAIGAGYVMGFLGLRATYKRIINQSIKKSTPHSQSL